MKEKLPPARVNAPRRGGRLPDPGDAGICANCGEPRLAHGGPKNLGACPDEHGLYAKRYRLADEDKPDLPPDRSQP